MNNLILFNKIKSPPKEALKKIGSGSRISGMTNISPMWRIKAITEEFGVVGIGWYYLPKFSFKEAVKGDKKEVLCFCDLKLFIKDGENWSMPIVGTGGSKMTAIEKAGEYNSDECKKMALSDALGVAMKAMGMAANIYMGGNVSDEKQKYVEKKEDVSFEDALKYEKWFIILSKIDTYDDLKKTYTENKIEIEKDEYVMKLFANKKNKIQ